jgi:hypothetical protein
MSSIKEELFKGKYFFNIALHVTILFTILSIFFIYYVRNISAEAINGEMKRNIDAAFNNIKNNKDLSDKINTYQNEYNTLVSQLNNLNQNQESYKNVFEQIKFKKYQLNILNFIFTAFEGNFRGKKTVH